MAAAEQLTRAEITVSGLVQGVGFRYFVLRTANGLGVFGWVKNLPSGEVLTVAEGEKKQLQLLFTALKEGPSRSRVTRAVITWGAYAGEFSSFEIRHW